MDAWSAPVFALALVLALGWVHGAPPGENCRIPNTETFNYDGRQYILFLDMFTWDESEAFCKSYQAELVNVHNMDIASYLIDMVSESNKRISEVWIGGRRVNNAWVWSQTNGLIGERPNKEGFPPWVYTPKRSGKDCLALDRRGHYGPAFVNLDCLASRQFICERGKSTGGEEELELARTVRVSGSIFYIYRGRLDWFSAVTQCRKMGTRLAVVPNKKVIYALSQAMTKSRPDLNTAWIGGKYSFGSWKWMSTGETIPDDSDPNRPFPPWKNTSKMHKNYGCLLFDRHLCEEGMFADVKCQRTRDFICEDSGSKNLSPKIPDSEISTYHNKSLELDVNNATWQEANNLCIEKGGRLVHIQDLAMLEFIIDLMAEPLKVSRVTHIWIGGEIINNTWMWTGTTEVIPLPGVEGFPPWCEKEVHADMPCLNLDRAEQNRPAFYGLECNNTQPFLCQIDCQDPLRLDHGSWQCSKALTSKVRTCDAECKPGYRILGTDHFYCTQNGWKDLMGQSTSPECLSKLVYNSLLIDKLSVQTQQDNITSLLFAIEDSQYVSESTMQGMMHLVATIVRAIRLSDTLKGGVLAYGEKWAEVVGMQSRNTCSFIQGLPAMANMRMFGDTSFDQALNGIRQQIENFDPRGKTAIIVLGVSDAGFYTKNLNKFDRLQSDGHVFYCVALNVTTNEGPSLTSSHLVYRVSSVGPDETYNTFIYHSDNELDELIAEIGKRGKPLEGGCGIVSSQSSTDDTNDSEKSESQTAKKTGSSRRTHPVLSFTVTYTFDKKDAVTGKGLVTTKPNVMPSWKGL